MAISGTRVPLDPGCYTARMADRIEALREMLAQDPNNTFVRYGLAMEHMKAGAMEDALSDFRAVLSIDPNYSAAYFHGGQTLERMGRIEDAREMYERGIEATQRNGDAHTRSELQAALDLLPL